MLHLRRQQRQETRGQSGQLVPSSPSFPECHQPSASVCHLGMGEGRGSSWKTCHFCVICSQEVGKDSLTTGPVSHSEPTEEGLGGRANQ